MTRTKLLSSLRQISVILIASLLVVGATYVYGQQYANDGASASERGGVAEQDEGRGRPDLSGIAAELGVPADEFAAAVDLPPDFEVASAELGIPAGEIEAAFEAAGRGASIATFARTLIPIFGLATIVALIQTTEARIRRRRK